jgi:hypothetical protein
MLLLFGCVSTIENGINANSIMSHLTTIAFKNFYRNCHIFILQLFS